MTEGNADPDCLFCKIVAGDIHADVVHESDTTLAFRDLNPQAPTHVLVIPRSHYPNAASLAAGEPETAAHLFDAARHRRERGPGRGLPAGVQHRCAGAPDRLPRPHARARRSCDELAAGMRRSRRTRPAGRARRACTRPRRLWLQRRPRGSRGKADAATTRVGHAASPHDDPSRRRRRVRHKPLRAGERRVTVRMPTAYTPSAPTGIGTDDYRCFLLDPKVAADQFITGFNVLPGNPDVVHHVILFRVPADLVAEAEQRDADDPGPGLDLLRQLRAAQQRLGDRRRAVARCLGSRRIRAALRQGLGEEFGAGSRIIMQVHYNLLAGQRAGHQRGRAAPDQRPDQGAGDPAAPRAGGAALSTRQGRRPLRAGQGFGRRQGALRRRPGLHRERAPSPLRRRTGRTDAVVHRADPLAGDDPWRRGAHAPAGPLHQGRGQPGNADARTILDIPVWDFDNQGSRPTPPIHRRLATPSR